MIELLFLRLLSWFVLASLESLAAHQAPHPQSGEVGCAATGAGRVEASLGKSLRREFSARGIRISSAAGADSAWEWSLALAAVGRGAEMICASEPAVHVQQGKVEYRREGIVEWYVDHRNGIEHGFTLESRPVVAETGPLRLELEVGGTLRPSVLAGERGARFEMGGGRAVLLYDGLLVLDADHRPLPARLVLEEDVLVVEIDDEGASWPIAVDPVIYTEDDRIVPADPTLHSYFGISVGNHGDTLVVGDHFAQGNPGYGGAFVYVRSGSDWVQQGRLFASDGAVDYFGLSVAISGDVVVAGAHKHDTSRGAAYVFVRNGTTWTEAQKLTANDAAIGDEFGYSVSIDGGTILVGARADDDMGQGSGSAYVFCHDGSSWVQTAKLVAPDGAVFDQLGFTVLIQGRYAFCAAVYDEEGGIRTGSVYVFEGTCSSWSFRAKLVPSDGVDWGAFGTSLGARDGRLAVGLPEATGVTQGTGAVYVYQGAGPSWNLDAKVFASDGQDQDYFGSALALDQDLLFTSSAGGSGVPGAGSIYVFRRSPTGWIDEARLVASDGPDANGFGRSIASDDGTVVVGANRSGPLTTGAAYVFELEKLQSYCFGDGSGFPCPCGNTSGTGAELGCVNSTGLGGRLMASGTSSLSAGDLVLAAEQIIPNQPALLFAGQNRVNGGAGLPFGDGLRCAGTGVVRFSVQSADAAGSASWGPGLALPADWMPGDRSHFQAWYRDPAGSPCGTGFNTTNGLTVLWVQ